MFKYWRFKRFMKKQKKYNANLQGWLLVKCDRICKRLYKNAKIVKMHNNLIAVEDFLKYEKSMEIMIAQELCYKKYLDEEEEEKCRSYTFSQEKQRIGKK